MDIYELMKACNISLITIDGKQEIAEQITIEKLREIAETCQNSTKRSKDIF